MVMSAALCGAATPPGPGTEVEAIREEMRQLRRDYEERLRRLEERLQQLESPPVAPSPSPATPAVPVAVTGPLPPAPPASAASSAAPVSEAVTNAALAIRQFARDQFQRGTESRERALLEEPPAWRERFEQVLQDFIEIHGYFRAGYGRNDQGGSQVGFQAPGAFSKYRLGNEAENYGELTLGKNFYVPDLFSLEPMQRPDGTPTGPIARVQVTLSMFNPHADLLASGSTDFGLPEAWASIGNVVASQPSMKFWAGSRYYRRHDIHISDFFFFNMSGTGGGMEDLALPFGRVDLSWIGAASTSGFSDLPEPDASNEAGFSKGNLDLRLHDVHLPFGQGEFGFVYARADSGLDANGRSAPDADGVAFTALHTAKVFADREGVNKFSAQFGTGAAKTFTSGFETQVLTNGVFILPDDRDSWRLRFTEHFTANFGDYFSLGPAVVYQVTDYADEGGRVHWASVGVRPVVHFNRALSLAVEAGLDWVRNEEAGTSDTLYKLTLAPQVSLGDRFMSRPVIRAFVTYAGWGDDFVGEVGGNDYRLEDHGLTYGIQMEAWW